MTPVVAMVMGAVAGLGILLALGGLRGERLLPETGGRVGALPSAMQLAFGSVAAVGALAVTGWPVAAALGGWVGVQVPVWWRARGRAGREIAVVESIATWAEQLRDTLAAANGLEHAIGASAELAPGVLRDPVRRLAARVEYESLPIALRRFADEVAHPSADFVVAALVVAAENEARELGPLLGHLATCAREDARMRERIWVGRARTRTAVRIILGVVVAFVVGLVLLDRPYLAAYDTADGQVALLVVVAVFIGAFVAMERMGRSRAPDRFVGRREPVVDR